MSVSFSSCIANRKYSLPKHNRMKNESYAKKDKYKNNWSIKYDSQKTAYEKEIRAAIYSHFMPLTEFRIKKDLFPN